ncbi:hypothetical protein O6H91_12G078300 [Diphasiastrum complanatum]|uniref:Uncharacterized protein n=1 Tax=Diphasiastrum complanatum TaxID=34168 RepID=A0ACC2C3X6_DIPCM|nr:hypothetical protein O6H91_12G078300 [Diphasiastrum complanatum]
MGRVKLEIKKIENASNRQVTYSKRKQGLTKKASELATLCDTDVALIMFSPTGRLFNIPSGSRIEDIINRFATIPQQERQKRKQESFEILNKIIRSYSNEAVQLRIEDSRQGETSTSASIGNRSQDNSLLILQEELRRLQYEHSFLEQKLRIYQGENVGSIQTLEELSKLEEMIQSTLVKMSRRKQELINGNLGYMMQSIQNNQMQSYSQICPTQSPNHWTDSGTDQYSHRNFLPGNAYATQEETCIEKSPPRTSFQLTYANQDASQISTPTATHMLFNLSQELEHGHRAPHHGIFMEDSLSYVKEECTQHPTPVTIVQGNHASRLSQSLGMGINVGGWQHHSSTESGFLNHFLPRSPGELQQQQQDVDPTLSRSQHSHFVYNRPNEKHFTR